MPAVFESFAPDDLLGAASRLGERVRQGLGLSLNDEERARVAARLPHSAQAARFFAEGMSRLVADDIPGAQRLFAAASATDGSFHAAVLAEAESWLAIGNLRQARRVAQRAKDLARALSLREQRESEIALARASEDEDAARTLEKALFADWPDEPRLAEALVDAATTAEEGRAVLGRWRQASPSGAFDFALEAEEATMLARSQGAPAADAAFERLEERARGLGASREAGTILLVRATTFARSDHSRSLAYVRQAQEAFQQGGFLALLALAKGDEALYLREKGDPQQEVALRESSAIYRRLGLRRAASNSLVLMGWAAFYRGDVVQARARLQEMEDESRAIEASPTSWALGLRAWVEWTEGNLAESRHSLQEMRKRAEVEGSGNAHAGMPNLEGMILTEEDRIPEAIAILEQGREQFASLGLSDYEWKCALMACRASCRGGHPLEGLACLARVDGTRVKNSPWLQPQFEAECLIEAGESSKAKLALARASSLGESYGGNHLGFEVLRARVETLEGRARQAVTRLRSVAAEARRRHWNGLALEGELALGKAELAAGIPGARKRLLAVQEEASRRGFMVIGRRAGAALASD
jgi:tetratricopeptide (TPR) repeat protein